MTYRLGVDVGVGVEHSRLPDLGLQVGTARETCLLAGQLAAPVLAGQLRLAVAAHHVVVVVRPVGDVEGIPEVPAAPVDDALA